MCDIRGVGVDLCSISRMEEKLTHAHFMERIFTSRERDYIASRGRGAAQTMAGIFAAKEAACKALGTGIAFPLTEIEVGHTEQGQPVFCLHGSAAHLAEGGRISLSISHEGDMAIAFAVWSADAD